MQSINQPTRAAPPDDDNTDHIGTDTPGSGIATPQPDPQDKRLPGIMSYFGQVRQDSPASVTPLDPVMAAAGRRPSTLAASATAATQSQELLSQSQLPNRIVQTASTSSLPAILSTQPAVVFPSISSSSNAYPTPPASKPCSSASSAVQASGYAEKLTAAIPGATVERAMSLDPSTETALPTDVPDASSMPPPPTTLPSNPTTSETSSKWFSFDTLKELTRSFVPKSGPSTPTRALSAAHPQPDGKGAMAPTSNDGAEKSGTQTPRGAGAQPPATKGKLTIKISEARGLRKCRDPYVVAVFQRSELISSGPRPSEDDENLSATPTGVGSIAIQRQASDSGRPMAIPMRSRQSSNTSVTEYNTFRSRSVNKLYTNPKWDAEAVLLVNSLIYLKRKLTSYQRCR